MNSKSLIIAVELVMIFGGALMFGWWQMRSIKNDQQKAAQQKLLDAVAERSRAGETTQNPNE